MTAIGYIRVSSQEQADNEASLDRQRQYIENYCNQHELNLVKIISDVGKSGYKSSRVGFEEVRQRCLSGAVDTVIVYDLSRLSRSVRSTLEFVEDVIVRNKISFVSLQLKIDTSTPSGKAFLAISAVFNQLYRDEISFKAKKAIDHKQQNGLYIGGHVPYGYQVASDGFSLVEEPVEVVVIARVKALRDRGYSLRAIAKKLDVEGLRPRSSKGWNPSSIRKIVGRTW